jgi:hypothetical protein
MSWIARNYDATVFSKCKILLNPTEGEYIIGDASYGAKSY